MSEIIDIELVEYEEKYAEAAVRMWRDSKKRALGVAELHSFGEHLDFLKRILARDTRIHLALLRESKQVVGLIATGHDHINQLYVHVEFQRMGIGSRLLALAKEKSAGKLRLYTFEVNRGARAFYEKHGFTVIARGNENEEGLPDILYEWSRSR